MKQGGSTRGPLGEITRGTTAPNRLRRFDRWIISHHGSAIRSAVCPLVVDLGFGAQATTTLELFARLSKALRLDVEVLGVEIDPLRVANARAVLADSSFDGRAVSFEVGGFEIPTIRRPVIIRACNVLRQYPELDVGPAWAAMVDALAPGGALVEGTCDELGRLATWVSIRAECARGPMGYPIPATFTVSAHLGSLHKPSQLAARLPKALIHHNVAGEKIHHFLSAMDQTWERAAPFGAFGPRQRWIAMCRALQAQGHTLVDGPNRWRHGELTVPWASVA